MPVANSRCPPVRRWRQQQLALMGRKATPPRGLWLISKIGLGWIRLTLCLWVIIAILFLRFLFRCKDPLIHLKDRLGTPSLAEMCHQRRVKRFLVLKAGQANEVLQIRVFHDLLHRLPITQAHALLDDQRPQCHANRDCLFPSGQRPESTMIFNYHIIPRDHRHELDPESRGGRGKDHHDLAFGMSVHDQPSMCTDFE